MMGPMSVNDRIAGMVREHPVLLFMKGTRAQPRCGFSATVVTILDEYLEEYGTFDVLADPEVREGVKEFSNWPTIPQLYVGGKFIGGSDIVKEMDQAGELAEVLGAHPRPVVVPEIALTEAALAALRRFAHGADPVVRLEVPPSFQYGMDFDSERPGDVKVQGKGFTVLLSRGSARRADGLTIDFVDGPGGGGFKIDNPNEPPKVQPLSPPGLARLLEQGAPLELFDVRTPVEIATAAFPGARVLDAEGKALLDRLDRETPLVLICHHGQRSQAAAEHCLRMGFRTVYNLVGGIDAWSREVDPAVPRYLERPRPPASRSCNSADEPPMSAPCRTSSSS